MSILALLPVDRSSKQSLTVQVYLSIRSAILTSRLPLGARLPSTRELGEQLGVSRGILVAAFERLKAEGYIESRVGEGTHVAAELAAAATDNVGGYTPSLSHIAASLALTERDYQETPLRPFKVGISAVDAAPLALWGRLLRSACVGSRPKDLDAGDPLGLPALRQALAERLYRLRGLSCHVSQIAIVASSQQAFDLLARLLLNPGDKVAMEDPGYPGARAAWTACGANIMPVPVDDDGLRVGDGEAIAADAKLIYVTPSHQFPSGVQMSSARRLQLLRWAERSNALVVEDDYDNEFRFDSEPEQSLFALSRQGNVCYVGTFSKLLFPAIRMAYMVLPTRLLQPFAALRRATEGFPAVLAQQAAWLCFSEGHFERHIREVHSVCAERRQALISSATRYLPQGVSLVTPKTGLQALLRLPAVWCDQAIAAEAAKQGIEVIAISHFSVAHKTGNGLLLGFAAFTPTQIDYAMRQLAAILSLPHVRVGN